MKTSGHFPNTRLRRLRSSHAIRSLVRETELSINKLVQPLFIKAGNRHKTPILSMPTQYQLSLNDLPQEIAEIKQLGIQSIILFGIPEKKDPLGQEAYSDQGIVQQAIRLIKNIAPDMFIISDICFCEYTDHGHCGVLNHLNKIEAQNKLNHLKSQEDLPKCAHHLANMPPQFLFEVDNDATLELLAKQAVSHAQAGADLIAPSGNMDGMVQAIRQGLDVEQLSHIPILSYAVKYASALYGPFRHAAEGAPQFGDRRSYQMDFSNAQEALRECALDVAEGADMLMVKPAHAYLDIIYRVKQQFPDLPLGAYHTSGEFAMLKAAGADKQWIDERKSVIEILTAIHRAGADFIITYYAKEVAGWLR